MRTKPSSAFTLLELLTVMAIIAVLAGLVISGARYATNNAARARATGEIKSLESACASYKADNGAYPRDTSGASNSVTDTLSPKQHFVTNDGRYAASSLFLYRELSGDKQGVGGGQPDGAADAGEPVYLKDIQPKMLNARRNPSTKQIIAVNFIQDPFGNSYAYSTAAAKTEQDFKKAVLLKQNPTRLTGNALPGFNIESFDLWSTAGSTLKAAPSGDQAREQEWAKWIKNW